MPPAAPTVTPTPKPLEPTPKPSQVATPPAFAPSTATVEYGGLSAKERKRSEAAARRVFRNVPPEEYASVIGAPDGGKVTIDASGYDAVSYAVTHPSLQDMRGRVKRDDLPDVPMVHLPDVLYVKPDQRGNGVGAEIHGRRVAFGAKHGVDRIRITAARGEEEVGYIVWPTLGYDGKLPKSVLDDLPEQLKGRATIQELLADEGGQRWWKKHGRTIDLTFDLKPESKSIIRWATYWAAKLAGRLGK
jgi:GNAT superfamily N-acetyltransferase